jgi:hypothetical protein
MNIIINRLATNSLLINIPFKHVVAIKDLRFHRSFIFTNNISLLITSGTCGLLIYVAMLTSIKS